MTLTERNAELTNLLNVTPADRDDWIRRARQQLAWLWEREGQARQHENGRRSCPVCKGEMIPSPNVYEMSNGYIYARDLDECPRCCRQFVSGLSRFVEHLSDAQRAVNAHNAPPSTPAEAVHKDGSGGGE